MPQKSSHLKCLSSHYFVEKMNNVPGTSQAWCDDVIVAARPTFMTFLWLDERDGPTDRREERKLLLALLKGEAQKDFFLLLLRNVFEISSFFNFGFR